MKLRSLLSAGVAGVGLTAATNRVLRHRARNFEPFLDASRETYRWRGFEVSYAEAGDPADPDLVLLHGINAAASNHEFWAVFDELAAAYHVIAPDLLGFGHSDRPALLYAASLYEALVADVVADLADDEPVVVGSSLTAAYVASAAGDVPVDRLVLVCPTATTMGPPSPWRRTLFRTPLVGQGLFNILVSKPGLRRFHEDHGYYDMANLPAAVLDYEWTTAHQPGARYAPASFVGGFLDPDQDLGADLAAVTAPVTLVWGREADITPVATGRELAERADARLVVFDEARLLPHVEHPAVFADVVGGTVPTE